MFFLHTNSKKLIVNDDNRRSQNNMYIIKVTWRGGPEWNPDEPSLFDPSKNKSPVEHLIETGGQTIEETFEAVSYFKSMPIILEQIKGQTSDINWTTTLSVDSTDPDESKSIKDDLLMYYEKKKLDLEERKSDYKMFIEIIERTSLNDL